jgi:thioesterase domain-containing protein
MLMPISTSGTRPPLFLIHGNVGDASSAGSLTHVLGPERPVYAIHANGMDGREAVIDNMPDMVSAYVEQIRGARPTGLIHIGGFCMGTLTAIEVTRALQKEGRRVGPVILVDPPNSLPGLNERTRAVDHRAPLIAEQLYRSVYKSLSDPPPNPDNDEPFDRRDPQQMHAAALAGVGTLVALVKHRPQPFFGYAQVIVSAVKAFRFFDPEGAWQSLLAGPHMVHVAPYNHDALSRSGRGHLARVVKFLLEASVAWTTVVPQDSTYRPEGVEDSPTGADERFQRI